MKRATVTFLLLFLPLAAWADGMVIPTVAYPAKVTIPDQQAVISFTNGIERLVIETRFTGAGTNFAWIVPLPSQPIIEQATTGLFPTLQYLFRPEVVHDVPKYFIGILIAILFMYLAWRTVRSVRDAFAIALMIMLFLFVAAMLLPAVSAGKRKAMATSDSDQSVSILDRKLVGIFETATISSQDPKALANWLRDNDYAVPPNAGPVIEDYVKEGWVFVASKVSRSAPEINTNSPHPLSFTFKTARPVYPMRLTGLAGVPLNVDIYYFGDSSARAPYFDVESSSRTTLYHPLLRQWFGISTIVTKLSAQLSPAQMRGDVWLQRYAALFPKENRLYSRHGALITSLNWGVGVFALGLLIICVHALVHTQARQLLRLRIYGVAFSSLAVVALIYLALPKIDVRLFKGHSRYLYSNSEEQLMEAKSTLDDLNWNSIAEVPALLRQITSDPTNSPRYGIGWQNSLTGGQFREEDSPGNYILRETNNELLLILMDPSGSEDSNFTYEIPRQHKAGEYEMPQPH